MTRIDLLPRKWNYRLLDWMGSTFSRPQPGPVKNLIEKAQKITGLSDWGEDRTFFEPLQVLIDSLSKDAQLSALGTVNINQTLLRILVNRLLIQKTLVQDPSIRQHQLPPQLIISGLPRTGTTLLHRLLAQDKNTRTLQTWELMGPAPPPDPESYLTDKRRKEVQGLINRVQKYASPQELQAAKQIHYSKYDDPEECIFLLARSFLSDSYFPLLAYVPSYLLWLEERSVLPAYEYYKTQLQILLYKFSSQRLVLKAPAHLAHLSTLTKVFPQARVIWIHRDPVEVIASGSSLVSFIRRSYTNHLNLSEIGLQVVFMFQRSVQRAMDFCTKNPSAKVMHISYQELVGDPLSYITKVYASHNQNPTAAYISAIRDWLGQNPQNKHGKHKYKLEDFGLTNDQVAEKFTDYNNWWRDACEQQG
jgi:hypothetical protein